jgi:hypothetical protein
VRRRRKRYREVKPEEFQSILKDALSQPFNSIEERQAYFVLMMDKARAPKRKKQYARRSMVR